MHSSKFQDDKKKLQLRTQAHLLSAVKKVKAFLESQGVLLFKDALLLLECITSSVLHDLNKWCEKCWYCILVSPCSMY
jgi:hypothetical protein